MPYSGLLILVNIIKESYLIHSYSLILIKNNIRLI